MDTVLLVLIVGGVAGLIMSFVAWKTKRAVEPATRRVRLSDTERTTLHSWGRSARNSSAGSDAK